MNLFKKLFSSKKERTTALSHALELSGKLIVTGYRRIYAEGGIGASPEMPDALIVDIYSRVGSAFRAVSDERRELLSSGVLSHIVLIFLEAYRTMGSEVFASHLQYELDNYRKNGLRPDYQIPVNLF